MSAKRDFLWHSALSRFLPACCGEAAYSAVFSGQDGIRGRGELAESSVAGFSKRIRRLSVIPVAGLKTLTSC
jgi:hypothetical protein